MDEISLVNIRNENQIELYKKMDDYSNKAREFIRHSKAKNTIRAYSSDWRLFVEWCSKYQFVSLPAAEEIISIYITSMVEDGMKVSTIQRRLVAISQAHKTAKFDTPTSGANVRAVWRGIRREIGTAQKGKAPAVIEDIRRMVSSMPSTLLGLRNRTLILIGFAGAFRRSELVGLNRELLSPLSRLDKAPSV